MKNYILYIILSSSFFLGPLASAQQNNKAYAKKLIDSTFILLQKDQYFKAVELLDSVMVIAKKNNFKNTEARVYNSYGLFYVQIEDYNKAEYYYKKAISVYDSLNNKERLIVSLDNLAHAYVLANDFKKYDSIRVIYDRFLVNDTSYMIFYDFETRCIASYKQRKFEELLTTTTLALKKLEKEENQRFFQGTSFNKLLKKRLRITYQIYKGFALMELGKNVDEAHALFTNILKQDLENTLWYNTRLFKNKMKMAYYMSVYFSDYKKNIDSANFYIDVHRDFQSKTIAILKEKEKRNSKYVIKNIENSVMIEQSELSLKLAKDEAFHFKIIISFAILLCIGVAVFIFYLKKNNNYKIQLNEMLEKQNIALSNSIKEKEKLESKIENIQNEISKDLHDNFGNRFSAIQMAHDILKEMNFKEDFDVKKFKKFSLYLDQHISKLTADIEDLIWASKTTNNTLKKVVKRIEGICLELANLHNIEIDLKTTTIKDIAIPEYWNRQLLLIIKEAINNACTHAKASKIAISISSKDLKDIYITIADNGIGFDKNKLKRISGLSNMKSRAAALDLLLQLKSKPSEGTEIIVQGSIPQQKN